MTEREAKATVKSEKQILPLRQAQGQDDNLRWQQVQSLLTSSSPTSSNGGNNHNEYDKV